jgi:hypothetical protein
MTDTPDGETIVKTGTYLYDGTVVCDVRIVYSPIRYGSGDDHIDYPENVADRECDTYYLEYGGTRERGVFFSGGGGFDTVEDAMKRAAETVQGLEWLD